MRKGLARMKFPQLQMESVAGRINIEQNPAKLGIKQAKASLTIEQPKAEMNIQNNKGKMHIDQSQAWEDRLLMSTLRLNEMHAQEARQAIQEGTARRAEQGAQLLNIEEGGNIIAEQAIENGHKHMKQLSIKYVPSVFSVKFNYETAKVDMNARVRQPIIDAEINKPEITFERGPVNVSMAQYPELTISVIDLYT